MCIRDRLYSVIVANVVSKVVIVAFVVLNRVSVVKVVLYSVMVDNVVSKVVMVLFDVAVALVSIVLNVV